MVPPTDVNDMERESWQLLVLATGALRFVDSVLVVPKAPVESLNLGTVMFLGATAQEAARMFVGGFCGMLVWGGSTGTVEVPNETGAASEYRWGTRLLPDIKLTLN